jgi:hypothetical protein
MGLNSDANRMTPEQRLRAIAACLAKGIIALHQQGRLPTNPIYPSDRLDFPATSRLTVDSGSISRFSNHNGANNDTQCH